MIEAGDELPPFRVESVSADAMRVLAGILRDPNPIHLDPEAAAAAGLGERRINQGPANFSYVLNMLMRAFPQSRVARLSISFTDNVREGDTVTARARVSAVEKKADAAHVVCEFWLDVEGGVPALRGEATVHVPLSAAAVN